MDRMGDKGEAGMKGGPRGLAWVTRIIAKSLTNLESTERVPI